MTMKALIVHESMFGNTERIAEAVAAGLRETGFEVRVQRVNETAADLAGVDLLILGAPTHAFSLSRASTRADAVRQGAPPERQFLGMREWIEQTPRAAKGTPTAVFDTRAEKVRRLPMNAARKLSRLVRECGYTLVVPGEGFLVTDIPGPLLADEEDRATSWGRDLGRRVSVRV